MEDFFGNKYKKFIILPVILFVIMLIISFVYPGFSAGIDLTGGNLIIIRSQSELSEQQIDTILNEEFDLTELKVSTIAGPTGYGAWIEYSKDPIVAQAEQLINDATREIDNDSVSIEYSNQALVLLGKERKDFANAKLALLDAQDALTAYKEVFSTKLQKFI